MKSLKSLIFLISCFSTNFLWAQCTSAIPLPDELVPADRVQWANNRAPNTLSQDSYTYSPGGTTFTCGALTNDADKRDTRIVATADTQTLVGLTDVPQGPTETAVTYRRLNNVGAQTGQTYIDHKFVMAPAAHLGEKFLLRRVSWAGHSDGYFATRGTYTYDIKLMGDGLNSPADQQLVPATSRVGGNASAPAKFVNKESGPLDRILTPGQAYTLRVSIWDALNQRAFWDDTFLTIRVVPAVSLACDKTDITDSPSQTSTCSVTLSRPLSVDLSVPITTPASNSRYSTNCVSPLVIPAGETVARCAITANPNNDPGDGNVTASIGLIDPGQIHHAVDAYLTYGSTQLTVNVNNDDAPIPSAAVTASNDSGSTTKNTEVTINILGNDASSDPSNAPLLTQATPVKAPANGTVVYHANGTATYTPNADFVGVDTFEYEVCSAPGPSNTPVCASAIVTVTVSASSTTGAPISVPVDNPWALLLASIALVGSIIRSGKR